MPIGDYQSLMLPTLEALADGLEVPLSEIRTRVAVSEGPTEQEVTERLPSGRQTVLANRVSWALPGMERAGLVERVRRAVYRLTSEGDRLLERKPERFDDNLLRASPAFIEWEGSVLERRESQDTPLTEPAPPPRPGSDETPEEQLDGAARELRAMLESEVLDCVRHSSPTFLEQVVVDLLVSMGYGGGNMAMGRVTGRAGDGGRLRTASRIPRVFSMALSIAT